MGRVDQDSEFFCGLTMVQHDPDGKIVFLHRNMDKLTGILEEPPRTWTHLQEFKHDKFPLSEYKPGIGPVHRTDCVAKAEGYKELYHLMKVDTEVEELEKKLYKYAYEGHHL